MSYELFIGLRYLKAKRKKTFVSLITFISIAGVALGVMALIIVLAVMNGFEEDLRSKILGTYSHVIVMKYNSAGVKNYGEVIEKVKGEKNVISAAPFILSQVMLSSESNVSGVVIRGIDPEMEGQVTDLTRNMKEGDIMLLQSPDKFNKGEENLKGIILGEELSQNINAFPGDIIKVISPFGTMTPMGVAPKMQEFIVVGIFNSGLYEYDSNLAYISLESAQKFLNMGDVVTGIEVKIDDIYKAKEVAEKIQGKLDYPYYTRDWMEMNKNLFSALKLEKWVMFIILALIVLVAAFNIISTLIMVVMEKSKDISILKSMGAKAKSIMFIFMIEGIIIGVVGTVLGSLGGITACKILETYKFIPIPSSVYYFDKLPVNLELFDFLAVNISALLISFLATLYPSWQASKLDPVVGLRYE